MKFIFQMAIIFVALCTNAIAAVNINNADSSALQTFPGIGKAIAERILTYRNSNGPFSSCDELINVNGIGSKKLGKIKPLCIVNDGEKPTNSDASTTKSSASSGTGVVIDFNTAPAAELVKIKGIGKKTAQKIISSREAEGPFPSCDSITRVKGIGKGTLAKIKPFCKVSEVSK